MENKDIKIKDTTFVDPLSNPNITIYQDKDFKFLTINNKNDINNFEGEYVYWDDGDKSGQIFAPTLISKKREILKLKKKGFKKE